MDAAFVLRRPNRCTQPNKLCSRSASAVRLLFRCGAQHRDRPSPGIQGSIAFDRIILPPAGRCSFVVFDDQL